MSKTYEEQQEGLRARRRQESRDRHMNKKRVLKALTPKIAENPQKTRLKSLFEGFSEDAKRQINLALKSFEPLSRHKIDIFHGLSMDTSEDCFNVVNDKWANGFVPEINRKDFLWAKGMGWPHFKKMAEICLELEKAGACYIVEGKLKDNAGRPDITVLWYPSEAQFHFLDLKLMSDRERNNLITNLAPSDPFHIEVMDSENELITRPKKEAAYPFVVVFVRCG